MPETEIIRVVHPADRGGTKEVFKRWLSEWTGGPKLYTPEKGHSSGCASSVFLVGGAELDAWLAGMCGGIAGDDRQRNRARRTRFRAVNARRLQAQPGRQAV
ncbi:globin domain-containing protein [Bradyrhizobium cenepequi]|uniref:globin domain-containing protein n=1 Tax=Bradyrhizobium cenepequi TaxID=2821403 RepID=UPI0028966C3A|nr:hypothetical protein [Bradyrhizobium cenepequi]